MSHAIGFVSLVGAGPGDPDHLTLKAARRLREADLVLYDALVGPEVLALAARADHVFVGKRAGHVQTSQAAIHEVMIASARQGRRVVRLKGGDPFVFGRGAEEALALQAAGIPYEIVPGDQRRGRRSGAGRDSAHASRRRRRRRRPHRRRRGHLSRGDRRAAAGPGDRRADDVDGHARAAGDASDRARLAGGHAGGGDARRRHAARPGPGRARSKTSGRWRCRSIAPTCRARSSSAASPACRSRRRQRPTRSRGSVRARRRGHWRATPRLSEDRSDVCPRRSAPRVRDPWPRPAVVCAATPTSTSSPTCSASSSAARSRRSSGASSAWCAAPTASARSTTPR